MNKIMQIGNLIKTEEQKNFKNMERGRVYIVAGICSALNTVGGGGVKPKIIVGDDYANNKN